MKPAKVSILVLVALAVGATGCAHHSSATAEKNLPQVIKLPRRTLIFQPTRDDLTVGCAVFSVASSHPVRINGGEPESQWSYIYLRQVAKNHFELPALKIEYSADEPASILCMSVKVWFNEVTNVHDGTYYEHGHLADRYALVSWCTMPPEQFAETPYKARFSQNRVVSLSEFKEILSKPFVLKLNQQPLREDWGYPMVNNDGPRLSDADVKEVLNLVRDRGEKYLIGISVLDADHASVSASIQDATRFHGTRRYKIVRKDGSWEIESVVTEPNMARFVFW